MTRAQKLFAVRRTFEGTKYDSLISKLTEAWILNDDASFDRAFEKLPTDVQLLDNILEKVKGKRVFSTLKKTVNESTGDVVESLIGLSSLMTHVAIECKESREYRALLPDLHSKIGALIKHV